MAQVSVEAVEGQIRLTGDVPPEQMLLLLTQAVELVRVQVVAQAVAELPPTVTLAGPDGRALGVRGGDVNFRVDRGG